MIWRALAILFAVVALSAFLTYAFGHEVLLSLGLILTQAKIVAKKLMQVEIPAVLTWLKLEARSFLRIELFKKWFYSTAVPLVVGNAVLRRIKGFLTAYLDAVGARYRALLDWYASLAWYEKTVATLIVVFATLALTVGSLGLWLILFSVQLPLWVLAAATALGKMVWLSSRKMAFKAAAFFQLAWLWRYLRGRLPAEVLARKRRLDFRIARRVVRQRRMTLRQLAAGKDGLALRWAILRERWRARTGS